ncbi:MAG: energy transducer TonB [Cyclobacteriaceae bacterium]|nr:energy transducer TonB [Cyclobacteriaceae bacterium]
MENQEKNIRSWDDLIFENRNKSYGAYAMRQNYSNELIKGALTGIGILVSLLILAGVVNKKTSLLPTTTDDIDLTIYTLPPPTVIPVTPPPAHPQPIRAAAANLIPIATTDPDPVEPDPQPTTTATGTEGTTDGVDAPDYGTTGTINTGTDLGTVAVKNNEPFISVEVMPAYKGGMEGMIKTLKKNMRYPASARRMGKEGTVYVEFVVSDEGEIKDIKIIRGFDLDCDKEAVRIVEKLTEWSPGIQNKIAVNVKMVLPVKFQLEK